MIDKMTAMKKIAAYGRIDIPPALRKHYGGAAFMSGTVPDDNTNKMIDVESDNRRSPKINFNSLAWKNFAGGLTNDTNRAPYGHYPIQPKTLQEKFKWPGGPLRGETPIPKGMQQFWGQSESREEYWKRQREQQAEDHRRWIESERNLNKMNRRGTVLL